jgi:YggT family protein
MQIVSILLTLFTLALFGRAILSWFPISYDSPVRPVADFLHTITEPVLAPVRSVLPPLGGLDLSVFVVLIGLSFLRQAIGV